MFRVGMKVVCVDDSPRIQYGGTLPTPLVRNKIYTIRKTGVFGFPYSDEDAVWLNEIIDNQVWSSVLWTDYPFGARRFRPVVERKTSIEVFKQILRDVTARESVRA